MVNNAGKLNKSGGQLLSELRFFGLKDLRILQSLLLILSSLNLTNPNSDSFFILRMINVVNSFKLKTF